MYSNANVIRWKYLCLSKYLSLAKNFTNDKCQIIHSWPALRDVKKKVLFLCARKVTTRTLVSFFSALNTNYNILQQILFQLQENYF